MLRWIARARHFLLSEHGPTAVEYGVMLALIMVTCAMIISSLGTTISGMFSKANSFGS